MNTRTRTTSTTSRYRSAFEASGATFRQPNYDCRELPDAVTIVVYVPGVGASGVEIESHGPDLVITALKTRMAVRSQRRAEFAKLRDTPAFTRDGAKISLLMNAGLIQGL